MRFLIICTVKDLRRRLADPIALVLWLAIPLLVGGLMTITFGGGDGPPPKALVLLVDEDDSGLSQLLGSVARGVPGDFLELESTSRADGSARMDAGEATAMVVLPAGFGEALVESTPTAIEMVRNPAQVILPGIVQTGLEMLVEVLHYVQQFFAESLAQIMDATSGGTFLPGPDVAAISTDINERVQSLGAWLVPPAIELEFVSTSSDTEGGVGSMNVGALFLPSMMFMALLFIAQGMADDLWDEKDAGTLRRAVALPRHLGWFLGAKLATAAVIMTAVALVGLGVLAGTGAVTLARVPVALVWVTFGGSALYCFFLLLQFPATTRRGASVVGNVVLFPLMMIGGTFFPPEAMPDWMRRLGEWTPNGQALAQFKDLIAGDATAASLGLATLAIGVPAAIAFVISTRLVGGRFASRG